MENIKSRECKFVLSFPKLETEDDIHMVKEVITYEDGSIKKDLRILYNFKRPFWITKEHFRRHKQKKESEDISRLNKYYSTQKSLHKEIATRLGPKYIGAKSMRDVVGSPYVYGTDIDSRALIKHAYTKKYPDVFTNYEVAALDIEVDISTGEVVIISIACRNEVYLAILDKIIPNKRDISNILTKMFEKYIPKTDFNKNIKPIFELFNTEIEMLKAVLNKLHTWDIDFCAIWNIDYDIPMLLKVCDKYKVDPKDIFSDPSVPDNLKYFEYKQGSKSKLTESGVYVAKNPEEQWHTVLTPAKFYWIDAMCAHRYVRVGGKTVPGGYSLDNILEVELGKELKKLKFENVNPNNLVGIDWHRHMLHNHPLEYIMYNIWDTMSMLELDNKTDDLKVSIGVLSGVSSFDIFNSGPKKIVDALHFFYLENNRVLGTRDVKNKDDEELMGRDSWIVILESIMHRDYRKGWIKEDKDLMCGIKTLIFDLDAVSSYPSNTTAANVSKDTTSREIVSVIGKDKEVTKEENINLFFGPVNSIGYCQTMLNLPSLTKLEKMVKQNLL